MDRVGAGHRDAMDPTERPAEERDPALPDSPPDSSIDADEPRERDGWIEDPESVG